MNPIKNFRQMQNLSMRQLASLLGISPNTVSYLEGRKRKPTFTQLKRLVAIGINIRELDEFFNLGLLINDVKEK